MKEEKILGFCAHVARSDYPGFQPYWDDLISEGAIAILQGRDVHFGIKDFLRRQRRHEIEAPAWEAASPGWRRAYREVEFWIDARWALQRYRSPNHRRVDVEEYLKILRMRMAGYDLSEIAVALSQHKTTVFFKLKRAIGILSDRTGGG